MTTIQTIILSKDYLEAKSNEEYTEEQVIAMFLAFYNDSKYTQRNYERAIAQFRNFVSFKPIGEITWKEIEVYKLALLQGYSKNDGRTYAPATVASLLAPLRSLFKWGSDPNIRIFKNNPTSCVKSPKVSINSSKHYLTKSEISCLFKQLKQQGNREFLIGMTLVFLGLRVSELISIVRSDFYSDMLETSMWLTVRKGKGGKKREIKIPQTLWLLLEHYFEERQIKSDERIFPLSVRQIERIVETARNSMGMKKKVTPHWLRHTNATLALLSGASLQQVQEMLGHVHINTTQRYIHTVDQIKKAAPEFVEDSLSDVV